MDEDDYGTTLDICDLLLRTRSRSFDAPEGHVGIAPVWTHGECLRYATMKRGTVTIWEVAFTSRHMPEEVESWPATEETVDGRNFMFLPTLSRLAFLFQDTILVLDANTSNYLLESGPMPAPDPDVPFHYSSSFSPDGRFFASTATPQEIHVWKEVTTGYALHQKFSFAATFIREGLLFSPNGESILLFIHQAIHTWSTRDQSLFLPSIPVRDIDRYNFVLEFSPCRALAAFVPAMENMVTVLDLASGHPRLVIDAGMRVLGLGITGSTILVVGERKIVTWNVPAENRTPSSQVNITDSVQTTTLDPPPSRAIFVADVSVSPDLSRIAYTGLCTDFQPTNLRIYNASTGRCLAGIKAQVSSPRFTPGGREVWGKTNSPGVEGWAIVEDRESGITEVEPLAPTACPPGVLPWQSSQGYEVTDDGWKLNSDKRRLLWLPHHWRSDERCRIWSCQFLGLGHPDLPDEAVVLEFFE